MLNYIIYFSVALSFCLQAMNDDICPLRSPDPNQDLVNLGMDVRSFPASPLSMNVQNPVTMQGTITAQGEMGMHGHVNATIGMQDMVTVAMSNDNIRAIAIPLFGAIGFGFGLKYLLEGTTNGLCCMIKKCRNKLNKRLIVHDLTESLNGNTIIIPPQDDGARAVAQILVGLTTCAASASSIILNDKLASFRP